MIKFFRKIRQNLIRQNKTSTYFKYAIGEIILVVIGILIALQINTWNELRKNNIEGLAILNNLKIELQEDLSITNETIASLKRRKQCSDYLHKTIVNKTPITKADSSTISISLMRSGFIYKFVPSFAVYNEIQNSGNLGLIKSDSIKKLLANYRSQTDENIRIEGPYELAIKNFEKKAVRYLSEVSNSSNKPLLESYKLRNFNLDQLSTNADFLDALRHLSYITNIEIALKTDFLIPNIELLIKLITKELDNA